MSARTRSIVALSGAIALALAVPSRSQAPQQPPVDATVLFKSVPAGSGAIPLFGPADPITLLVRVQVKPTETSDVVTTKGFSTRDFYRLLYFTRNNTSQVSILTPTGEPLHGLPQAAQCFNALHPVTAVPVMPTETLPRGSTTPPRWFVEYEVDARKLYDLSKGGRYTAKASIPLSVLKAGTLPITDCTNFSGSFLDVGPDSSNRADFTVVSNTLDFRIRGYTFVGFASPVGSVDQCATWKGSCLTTNLGNSVPFKFQLFNASNVVVTNAVATISVKQVSGTPPPQPPGDLGQGSKPTNTFRYDAGNQQYVFQLDTSVLSTGIWAVTASIDDGTDYTVQIRIR